MLNALRDAFEIGAHPLSFRSARMEAADDFDIEHLVFESPAGEEVRGVLTRPRETGPHPAILYIHAHGNRHDIGIREMLEGRPALQGPLGPEFARRGYVTLMTELPAFGHRAEPGESARAKAALWRGNSLAGQMVAEQASALDWLASRDDVDAGRAGAFGISMGATLSYWLAGVDPRITAVAQLCAYADLETLIETGAHDLHGIYMTVPGLLKIASNGRIAGSVAPRPQLIGIGDLDPLTPPRAVETALDETRALYAATGAADNLAVHREPDSGHVETAAMREAVLSFFERHLQTV
ncbi:alpha/beta hydrolase family protein [Roseibium marinum]|uniref:X-Pro dipeptidyl-peptidase-like protein n=1 Tax=Roseibium marinum TaxID=281252 RepID=A0A2S3UJX0_9HYPH|nr:CocE/NonD family hydrolase [Roseibium marinum]POF27961.1 X-Pro dipeptidyl-peptidase-like protein [Roseibium marinum]